MGPAAQSVSMLETKVAGVDQVPAGAANAWLVDADGWFQTFFFLLVFGMVESVFGIPPSIWWFHTY